MQIQYKLISRAYLSLFCLVLFGWLLAGCNQTKHHSSDQSPADIKSNSIAHLDKKHTVFIESDGVLVVEMESTNFDNTDWTLVKDQKASNGAAIKWTGDNLYNQPGEGLITVEILITTPGTYRFDWANKIGEGIKPTEANDSWLKILASRFYGVRDGDITCPKGFDNIDNPCIGSIPEGAGKQGWFKVYRTGGDVNEYIWSTKTFDRDPHDLYVDFNHVGRYKILISGRSTHHIIDRFILTNHPKKHEAAKTQISSKRIERSVN